MHDWRYAPTFIIVSINDKFYSRRVSQYIAHPANTAPKESPIKRDMVTLQCVTDAGASAWYGVDEAKINSELKMVVRGGFINPRNELSQSWLPVKEGCI